MPICLCVYICTYTHTHTYIYIYTYIHTHTHIYMFMCIYIYTHTHARARTHTHTQTRAHARTHTHTDLRNSYLLKVQRSSGSSNWVYLCATALFVYSGLQPKSKLRHIETWSAVALSTRLLCYRPAIFFRHLRLIVLSFPQETFGARFKYAFELFYLFLTA